MNTCPNFSDPNIKSNWDAITNDPELGKVEAMREFLLADQEERPMVGPEQVKERMKAQEASQEIKRDTVLYDEQVADIMSKTADETFADPDSMMGQAILNNPVQGKTMSLENSNKTKGIELLDKLSRQLGVDYNFISVEDAIELTSSSKNPYSVTKGPAFFYNGVVYFIGDAVNASLALHEFSHPIIRSIKQNNPLLFQKLYEEALLADPSLLSEAIAEYADLKEAVEQEQDPELRSSLEQQYSDVVGEEILVKALTKEAMLKETNGAVSTGFAKLIKDLFYAIKQTLRKMFGQKINISNLNVNTSMEELAQMLVKGENFDIDSVTLSQEDIVAYAASNSELMEEFNNITKEKKNAHILNMLYKMHEKAGSNIRTILTDKNYQEMIDLFADEFNRGDLQEIRSNLAPYVKDLTGRTQNMADEIEQMGKESQALISSIMRLNVMMKKMDKHLGTLMKEENDQDNMHKAHYYSTVIEFWKEYISFAKKEVGEAGAPADSEIMKLLSEIDNHMDSASKKINTVAMKGVENILWNEWADMAERADEVFDEEIKRLETRKASQRAIDNMYIDYHGVTKKQYERYQELTEKKEITPLYGTEVAEYESLEKAVKKGKRLTKEKVTEALKGEGMDANWYNSFLEGYLYNTDPVIGGFAAYFKNNMSEMESRAQEKLNHQSEVLKKLVKDAGINFRNIGDLGKKIGFVDKIGVFDQKTGDFVEKEIFTLLNPFKDYRYVLDRYKYEIKTLENTFNKSQHPEDKAKLDEKRREYSEHLRKYFHQEFNDDYYDKDKLLQQDEIGIKAGELRTEILNSIQLYSALPDDGVVDNQELINQKWNEYRLLYSLYYLNGNKKTGDDLLIAERLQEHKKATRDFYTFRERPGVFQNSLSNFEDALYEKLKQQKYIPGSDLFKEQFNKHRQVWIDNNTRVAIKSSFYQERNRILERIKQLTEKLPSTIANKIDFDTYWSDIIDVVSGFRDDDGQPVGTEMPEGRKKVVKNAQQNIEKAKSQWAGFSGLTVEEMNNLVALVSKGNKRKLTPSEIKTKLALIQKQKDNGLNKHEKAELARWFTELDELQTKLPTPYYLSAMNHWLQVIGSDNAFYKMTGATELTTENIDKIYDTNLLNKLFEQSPEFEKWFVENHVQEQVYDREVDATAGHYKRLYIWNVIKPSDPVHYERTTVKRKDGTFEIVPGLPSFSFYAREVKKEYMTGYNPTTGEVEIIVGEHKDNKGEWLPKNIPGSPYIKDEYFKLKNAPKGSEENNLFKILEQIKEFHLSNQEGLKNDNKLYYDFPRFEKSNLELLRTTNIGEKAKEKTGLLKLFLQRFLDWFRGAKDTGAAEINWKDENKLVRVNSFSDAVDKIPIDGLFNLTLNETSTDIISSMFRYMYGAERHKQLVKMNPVAQGIKKILDDPDNYGKELDMIDKSNFINRGLTTYLTKKDKYVRQEAFNNFYNREFEGQSFTGRGKELNWAQSLQKFLFKKSSFAFFAFNIPSALKNAGSAKYQALIHSAGRNDFNVGNLAKGEVWSTKYMFALSGGQAYKMGAKNLDHQLAEIMDPVQGRFQDKFGESFTRTGAKDVASLEWFYNFRKWTELQATMQTYGAMMYQKKIKMGDTEIDYMNAWELNAEGQIQLKKGIDARWGNKPVEVNLSLINSYNNLLNIFSNEYSISNEEFEKIFSKESFENIKDKMKSLIETRDLNLSNAKNDSDIKRINTKFQNELEKINTLKVDNKEFKRFKTRIHSVMNRLNGAYAKFDQPEMQRYLLFRFASFLKRYFTTMAMYRFGKLRRNIGTQEYEEGYYITLAQALKKIGTLNFNDLNNRDKVAAMKAAVEIGGIFVMGLMLSLIWGWDEDDEDRYEKLRARSGHMGFMGLTADNDSDRPFNLGGFISLHSMSLVMQLKAENEQFIPWFGYGTGQLSNLLDMKSIAFGPTIHTYSQLGTDFMNILKGNKKGYYQRDVGPYFYQQKGGAKLWAHMGRMFGLTGSIIDPAYGITNRTKAQSMKK